MASEPSAAARTSNIVDDGLTSPGVNVPGTAATDTFVIKRNGNGSKVVDETKPLHKNQPAPCNRFYLTQAGCTGPCNFCHDYQLTLAQLTTVSDRQRLHMHSHVADGALQLALDAKKSPCTYLLNGKMCPQGEQCHMGVSLCLQRSADVALKRHVLLFSMYALDTLNVRLRSVVDSTRLIPSTKKGDARLDVEV